MEEAGEDVGVLLDEVEHAGVLGADLHVGQVAHLVAGDHLCPEGAATYAAYRQALAEGRINVEDRVMLFNCGNGLKYPMPPVDRRLDRHQPIDWEALVRRPSVTGNSAASGATARTQTREPGDSRYSTTTEMVW